MEYHSHTRGNSTTKNKPQIFLLTAAPDSAQRTELTQLLLDPETGVNACVWTSDRSPSEQELTDLSDMSLFVLALTEAAADQERTASVSAVHFCYDKKIPLLPVYYISPDAKTEPAGSFFRAVSEALGKPRGQLEMDGAVYGQQDFKEQFTRKLRRMVISDETAREASDLFHKQIFLSYRKKDREQAITVMKAIHALPICEAIAIWFDDFLTAGRDFNDEIRKELSGSDVFALALTDHISEEGNYVLREEWPRAAQLKKKEDLILVEAGAVDRDALKIVDPPMTDTVPVGDPEVLREAIELSCLHDADRQIFTARQKYLLGIAYLSGIRVEKDPEHALRLLTDAADEGCAEAALQLGFMYLARVGVERDNNAALLWKEKAFDLAEKEGNPEVAYRVAFGDDGLALMEGAMDRQEQAREICRRMRVMLENCADSPEIQKRIANTLTDEADPHFDPPGSLSREILVKRLEQAGKSMHILEKLPKNEENEHALAGALAVMGELNGRLGDLDGAEADYKKSIDIMKKLADRTGSIRHRSSLASVWTALGMLYSRRFWQQPAQEAFSRAIPLYEELYAETNLPADREGLCYAYANYGSVETNYEHGRDFMEKAITLMEEIIKENPQDMHLRQTLEELRKGLSKQKKKPFTEKLLWALVILAIGGALVYGVIYLISAIIS